MLRPQHRIDAQAVFVCPTDSAWDERSIEADLAKMRAAGQDGARHPVALYHQGTTRFDLGAKHDVAGEPKSASDYLDAGQAWRFLLRRLSVDEYHDLCDTLERSPQTTQLRACRYGLASVQGPGAPQMRHPISSRDVDALFELDVTLPRRIGQAVILACLPLSDAEKKA